MATRSTSSSRRRQDAAQSEEKASVHQLHVPTISLPEVHVPAVTLPAVTLPKITISSKTVGRAAWWGGLATAAALGVVEWPVAGLVAAGTWVATRQAREDAAHRDDADRETRQH